MKSDFRKGSTVFRAIADPTRRALLDMLLLREQSVNELRVRFRVSQPAISQHLNVLRRAGLVRVRRDGRRRVYQLNAEPIAAIYRWAGSYKAFFDPEGHAWILREKSSRG
ncbi:MAG TPA: metalloregulator ArsR/SmtB family transcription factor [Candidatus Dormibacteraeota bacterium]|jgi:DNA-binding transcriptional ArsR family regulator|nr:metalloregulator ArsR/SmtB family transcription factor [Candidatus Dormibacteraeota bacterium]